MLQAPRDTRPRVLVTTGSESSGKTTLARQLASHLAAPLVEEMSRPYLETRLAEDPTFRYGPDDLLRIARLQQAEEQRLTARASGFLVCDTDLLVILVWSEVRYGGCDPWIEDTLRRQAAEGGRHYFLCDWRIPWEPDPLRENPHDRDRLFLHYEAALQRLALPYTTVQGSPEQRLLLSARTVEEYRSLQRFE